MRRYASGTDPFPRRTERGPSGRPLCRVCGAEVPTRRRTLCSESCAERIRLAYGIGVRRAVYRRDKGVCAACGLDTVALKREMNARPVLERRSALIARGFDPWKSLWEADHIVPVWDGGGLASLDGYQTLCVPCHRAKSAAEAALRAQRKREAA